MVKTTYGEFTFDSKKVLPLLCFATRGVASTTELSVYVGDASVFWDLRALQPTTDVTSEV